jgi:hypothetical protein
MICVFVQKAGSGKEWVNDKILEKREFYKIQRFFLPMLLRHLLRERAVWRISRPFLFYSYCL